MPRMPKRGVVNVAAQPVVVEFPALPLAGPYPLVSGDDPPARGKDQRPGQVRGGVVEHARRVGGHDAGPAQRLDVEVVVAHSDVAYRLEAGRCRQNLAIDAVGEHGQRALLAGKARRELCRRKRGIDVVVVDVEAGAQPLDDFRENGAADQNPRFHRRPFAHL